MKRLTIAVTILLVAALATLGVAACGDNIEQQGTIIVLEPDIPPESDINLDEALDGAKDVIERRMEEFGVGGKVWAEDSRLNVFVPGMKPDEAVNKIGRTGLLQFCQAVQDDKGKLAVVEGGEALYESSSCEPQRDEAGNILTHPPDATVVFMWEDVLYDPEDPAASRMDDVVWTPAKADLRSVEAEFTGRFLERNTVVELDPITGKPELAFNLNSDGVSLFEQITERLIGMPLTFFLDGDPIVGADGHIIAPTVQPVISDQAMITGLSFEDAQTLSKLLNAGAFPVPLRVVEQYETSGP